jgi:hypothetical protein
VVPRKNNFPASSHKQYNSRILRNSKLFKRLLIIEAGGNGITVENSMFLFLLVRLHKIGTTEATFYLIGFVKRHHIQRRKYFSYSTFDAVKEIFFHYYLHLIGALQC